VKASGCGVELSRNRSADQEAPVSHANATLTRLARLRLARLVVEGGWSYCAAAKMFVVSPRTAKKGADRYRVDGPAGMCDRSSRPHRSPTKTRPAMVRRIVRLRWRRRLGPVQVAGQLAVPASTVHAVLVRCRISGCRVSTGSPVSRFAATSIRTPGR
jgi:leucine-zipper of insertion element IS481